MKKDETDLEGVIREWRVTSPLPPRFREQVWKRIERRDVSSISLAEVTRATFAAVFARPAFAFAYVSVLLVAGLTLGFVQAGQKTARWDRQLEARYVQLLDPYQRGQ